MEITKTVLSFDEASKYTGISKSYLYKLTSGRKLKHSKPGGKLIFFLKDDLDNWLLGNRISTDEEIEEQAQSYCLANKKGGVR